MDEREVEVELQPDQPTAVAEAVVELLREDARQPDPWWQAGLEDALGT